MKIIGIDPGYAISGFGVIDYIGNSFKTIDYGVVRTPSQMDMPNRLKILYDSYIELFNMHKPNAVAIEELFFNTNSKTIITVSQARGIHILAAVNQQLEIYEYTPLQVKQGIVGYGRADKKQMQEMVKVILNLEKIPKPDDAADALAVAICHAHSSKFKDSFRL
ncbi:MAG TPA: crossover junction endodeoxyribonuclease RuvC [Clostridiales bacterium]|nr:crossover junction endodeoxyribonuclease RuvC [Clostridiales bacterium]